jgi:hypothetical protein
MRSGRVLVVALKVTENQCVVAGQLERQTSFGHSVAPEGLDGLRVQVDDSLPAGLGRTLDELGWLALVFNDAN